ncbi:uncharacterized protein Dvar_13380 [Desulfosarcina variabilis str. Montpellier]|jgi:hypothetical protein
MKNTLSNESISTEEIRGLCMNCGARHHCRFPDFGNNVVHCEEYYYCCPNEHVTYRECLSFGQTPSLGIDNWI